jgi:hypothetical protein
MKNNQKNCSISTIPGDLMAKNEGKLSTSKLIMIQHEIIVDPFFLYQMG